MTMDDAPRQPAGSADRMEIERVALLHRRAPLNQLSSVICTLFVGGILLHYRSLAVGAAWMLASLLLVVLRMTQVRRQAQRIGTIGAARRWARWFTLGAFLNGLFFAIPGVWLVPPSMTVAHISLVVVGAVLPAMSLTTLAGHRPAVVAFSVPLLLGYGAAAMMSGDWLMVSLGLAAIVYFAVILLVGMVVDRDVRLGLQRSLEIEALNADLRAARAVAVNAAQRLAQEGQELERRVGERTASLTQAMHELESFSYSVSHDLRTPLRAINGYATLLDEECGSTATPHAREYLARIRKATERLDCLIDELLDLSRMTRAEMNVHPVDLSALAYSVAAECAGLFPDRVVALHIAPGLHAQGDPVLLRVLLQNLFWNAWKFTSLQPEARIEFFAHGVPDAQNGHHDIGYCMADNGVGFDMKYADKLFKPFQRLHGASEFPGSGIGLATVARIAARHGGRVWADSAPGQGARFCFTLGRPDVLPVAAIATAAGQ